ncbi:ABC transporter permease [Vulcanisaeta souniana]|uniref:Peptide ABC transporter permease n=1 Tax=Vulcanisaeta souniana JCM 11219 TaxID=1293586 RepID=A0A830E7W6_9CREN|nr:ABC transporter permease [Vulcanisaeta souniana]BDR91030.1 peptide ABC transporter permease [Vulcanisaeta souniana JCM 11219]GGI80197.1 peptide ABC transporter permease [Vulcanisaeta souniana JCM 11219]
MSIWTYIINRAIRAFILILGIIVLTFLLSHVLAPNPAHVWAGPHAAPSVIQAIVQEYHLNQPLYVQLYYYLISSLTFNFGVSPFFKQPVSELIAVYLPRTLQLIFVALILTGLIGIFSGAFAAEYKDEWGDYTVKVLYLISWCMPPFLAALLLQLFIAYDWGVLPPNLIADPTLSAPKFITGFPTIDALIESNWPYFWSSLRHLVLPAFALALISFGIITRITRSSMLLSLQADYIRAAIMRGVEKRRVVYVHALKNSMIPIVTLLALVFSWMISGSVIIETIFSYQGLGWLLTTALYNYDYPTVIGCSIVIGIAVVLANFVADVLYAIIDPRIKLG